MGQAPSQQGGGGSVGADRRDLARDPSDLLIWAGVGVVENGLEDGRTVCEVPTGVFFLTATEKKRCSRGDKKVQEKEVKLREEFGSVED